MKKRFVLLGMLIIMLALVGCSTEYSEDNKVEAPNWTEDGKIVYVKEHSKWKTVYNPLGQESDQIVDELILIECNNDGSEKKEIGKITEYWSAISTSAAGDYVVIGASRGDNSRMYVMKMDGTLISSFTYGLYPDLSPDGSKIVYAKPNQGIWIMNRDGSGDHQIVNDTAASYPAWSPDDSLIGYLRGDNTWIVKTNGDSILFYPGAYFYDWVGKGINKVYVAFYHGGGNPATWATINVYTGEVDSTNVVKGQKSSWDGEYVIGEDSEGYFVCKIDGTDKHYIEP